MQPRRGLRRLQTPGLLAVSERGADEVGGFHLTWLAVAIGCGSLGGRSRFVYDRKLVLAGRCRNPWLTC
jgi:hypothetical protein